MRTTRSRKPWIVALAKLGACRPALKASAKFRTPQEAWYAADHGWLIFVLDRVGWPPGSLDGFTSDADPIWRLYHRDKISCETVKRSLGEIIRKHVPVPPSLEQLKEAIKKQNEGSLF